MTSWIPAVLVVSFLIGLALAVRGAGSVRPDKWRGANSVASARESVCAVLRPAKGE